MKNIENEFGPFLFKGSDGSATDKELDNESLTAHHIERCDTTAATFLDIAVLRCLFIPHWQEEGVYWCLHYTYNRLRKISEEVSIPMLHSRRRSNSLPIPQIEISVYQGTNSNSRDSPSGNTLKDLIEVPEQGATNNLSDCSESSDSKGKRGPIERKANSERKRNVKIASFKSLIESKIFSKSEKELERIGLGKKPITTDALSNISQDRNDVSEIIEEMDSKLNFNEQKKKKNQFQEHTTLGNTLKHEKKILSRSASVISTKNVTNLVKGKSMPSLT